MDVDCIVTDSDNAANETLLGWNKENLILNGEEPFSEPISKSAS